MGPIHFERQERLDKKLPASVRVVSYNILADSNIRPNSFPSCSRESLNINHRLPLLCLELESYEADVICLQEVDDYVYVERLEPFFIACKYDAYFSCKINGHEGVCTAYNKEKFAVISSDMVSIVGLMKKESFWEILSTKPELKKMLEARNQVLQLTVLALKSNPKMILLVVNTHLYFHSAYNQIRMLQTVACLRYIETIVGEIAKDETKIIAVMFCGDFNSNPTSGSIRLILNGNISKDDPDWNFRETESFSLDLNHKLKFTNSHKNESTTFTDRTDTCIDYIFYQPEKMELHKNYPPPNKSTLANLLQTAEDKVSLPSDNAPSDHLPLIADFVWTAI